MTSIAVLGATGNLGQHVCRQALELGWHLSVGVRSPARLSPEIAARARVSELDLAFISVQQLSAFVEGHDVLVFCAGIVTEGEAFVRMFDKAVSAVETLPSGGRPVCWFLAGAALLPLDSTGRIGLNLPMVGRTYWPHRENFERLQRSRIDWRLLCPGPMVGGPGLGLQRLRISIDRLPAPLPRLARSLPSPLVLPLFGMKIPEMIVPYADAAAVILAHTQRESVTSRHRVGMALPEGMRGKKDQWAAKPQGSA